jgi:hypothetical protein
MKTEDGRIDATGCIRHLYSKIVVFYILDTRSNLFFSLLFRYINRIIEGQSYLPFLQFHFAFLDYRVRQ